MSAQNDRTNGVLVGLAAGDALGAGYEFGPAFDGPVEMKGGGPFRWAPGEWTDDTQMAICIAEELRTGGTDINRIGDRFIQWMREANDVGNQTRAVLSDAKTGEELEERAAFYYLHHPNSSAGNGSLMRTGPVALTHIGDNEAIVALSRNISNLTHADPLAADACILWSLAINDAILNGGFPDMKAGLCWIDAERRIQWLEIINKAETQPPGTFTPNGYVVTAFQAAWSSIVQTKVPGLQPSRHLQTALENAVRIGNDTDTVAAIAGSLLGAMWGLSAVPLSWRVKLNGWPGYTTRDLVRLGTEIVAKGQPVDTSGWPEIDDMIPYYYHNFPQEAIVESLPGEQGITIGNASGARDTDADTIISLCRMGSVPLNQNHHDVWLIDSPKKEDNMNLEQVIEDVVEYMIEQRRNGNSIYLHCVQGESRTPTIAAAYLAKTRNISGEDALALIQQILPNANPNARFRQWLFEN